MASSGQGDGLEWFKALGIFFSLLFSLPGRGRSYCVLEDEERRKQARGVKKCQEKCARSRRAKQKKSFEIKNKRFLSSKNAGRRVSGEERINSIGRNYLGALIN